MALQWQLHPLKQILKRGLKPIGHGDAPVPVPQTTRQPQTKCSSVGTFRVLPTGAAKKSKSPSFDASKCSSEDTSSSYSILPTLCATEKSKCPSTFDILPTCSAEKSKSTAAFDGSMNAAIIQQSSPGPDFAVFSTFSPIVPKLAKGANEADDAGNQETPRERGNDDDGGRNASPCSHALSVESSVPSPPVSIESQALPQASESESKHKVEAVEDAKDNETEEGRSYSSDWSSVNETESDDIPPPPPELHEIVQPPPAYSSDDDRDTKSGNEDEKYTSEDEDFESLSSSDTN